MENNYLFHSCENTIFNVEVILLKYLILVKVTVKENKGKEI